MNGQHSYLLVEGQQDVFFLGRILQELGFHSARQADEVPSPWEPFVDDQARQRDQALRAAGRGSVPFWQVFRPACFLSDPHVVIIEPIGGNRAKFGRTLRATNELIDGGLAGLTGVGLLPDADADPGASLASAREALQSAGLAAPENNQQVVAGSPNTGIFVLPGGADRGGLEEILIDCAETVYPNLIAGARSFVDGVDVASEGYTEEDMREMRTRQGRVKAVVGSVSSVLKPGSTIQVSILRDRWICGTTLGIARVAALVQFVKSLCRMT